ncbi:MAG: HAMP domain-containing histidine kinase, partial [Bacteroidia bacterium]|nr:HAMP domain-containing histidine kinase [Bacteroidia bacterium]
AVSNRLLNTFIALQDSMEGKEREFKEMDVRQYILTLENQEENKLLKEENEKKQLVVIFAVSIGLFLLVLLLGGILLYKRTRNFLNKLTELNHTIELQKEELEQRNKDKDHILRIVAHDLRNPIWGINALSKIVLDEMQPSDKFYENIRLIHGSSHSTMTLINELVDATMDLDHNIQRSREDIYEVISNVVEVLKHRAAEKYQHLIWNDTGKSMYLSFNREKISRIINNLIYNAIKFSHRGGNIEISATATSENILIAIKDHGVGIPAHLQEKIFEMFTSAKREGTAGEKSIGLGLSICRGIAEAHGGRLWLESKEEEGTTFFLQLPIDKNE